MGGRAGLYLHVSPSTFSRQFAHIHTHRARRPCACIPSSHHIHTPSTLPTPPTSSRVSHEMSFLCAAPLALPTPRGCAFTSDGRHRRDLVARVALFPTGGAQARGGCASTVRGPEAGTDGTTCVAWGGAVGDSRAPTVHPQERVCSRNVLARGACPCCGAPLAAKQTNPLLTDSFGSTAVPGDASSYRIIFPRGAPHARRCIRCYRGWRQSCRGERHRRAASPSNQRAVVVDLAVSR